MYYICRERLKHPEKSGKQLPYNHTALPNNFLSRYQGTNVAVFFPECQSSIALGIVCFYACT
jgi:hypothetical protein